jgi:hypothetical protein
MSLVTVATIPSKPLSAKKKKGTLGVERFRSHDQATLIPRRSDSEPPIIRAFSRQSGLAVSRLAADTETTKLRDKTEHRAVRQI